MAFIEDLPEVPNNQSNSDKAGESVDGWGRKDVEFQSLRPATGHVGEELPSLTQGDQKQTPSGRGEHRGL